MANQTIFDFTGTTYAGEALAGYMAQSLLQPKLVERGLITVVQNCKNKRVLRNLDDTIVFQNPTANFVGQTNTIVPTERYLDPVKYEVHKEYDFSTIVQDWESMNLKPGAMQDYDGTVELSDFLVSRVMERMAIANEKLYLLGKGATTEASFSASYTGLLPSMRADSAVVKPKANVGQLTITGIANTNGVVTVASTATLRNGDVVTIVGANGDQVYGGASINGQSFTISVASATTFSLGVTLTGSTPATTGLAQFINESNVIDTLVSVEQQIGDALRLQPDLKIMVPMHVARAYRIASARPATGSGSYFQGERSLDFLGRVMEEMPYFEGNSILVARTSNLYLGVDLLGDASTIETVDMRKTTLDQVVRLKASMKSAVNYRLPSEILYLHPQA